MHARAANVLIAVLSLVLTDLAFTAAYRRLRPARVSGEGLRTLSRLYHHDLKPRASVDDERWGPYGASYRTNSLGFRDREVREVPPRASGTRLVFIGDSFTEGVGIAYEKTFVGIVSQALAPRGVEVFNAGVVSYCPAIYYRKMKYLLEEVGLEVDSVVVYIDIGDIEDEVTYKLDEHGDVKSRPMRRAAELRADQRHGGRGFFRFPRLKRFLDEYSLSASHVYLGLESLFPMEGNRAGRWTVDRRAFAAYGEEGLETARQNMERLHDLLRARGVDLTVAVYPWPDQILHSDLDSRQVTFWRDWAAARGAGFVDHFPQFIGRTLPSEVLDRYFIARDVHWNEAGHRLIAQGFLEHYDARSR